MKKNVVKLNESTLRQIVAESVKNILSEIDWKTYRQAQEKNKEMEPEYDKKWWEIDKQIQAAQERGDLKTVEKLKRKQDSYLNKQMRTSDFGRASNDAFDEKFFSKSHDRFNDEGGSRYAPFKRTDDGSDYTPEPWMDNNGNIINGTYFPGHGKVDGKYYGDEISYDKLRGGYTDGGPYYGELNGDDKEAYSDEELNKLGFPNDEINDIEKARREIRRYRNGSYAYDNEKGWHLKESKLKKIVAESVKKVLEEEYYPANPGPDDFDYSDYYVTVDEVNSLKQPVFDALNKLFDNMEHCVSEEIRKEASIFAEKANSLMCYIESFGNYDEWWDKQHS